jgi:hypothetical protein
MNKDDIFCHKIVSMPQFTHWINTVLICILHSQYSRILLLKNNTLQHRKTDILANIMNQMLKNRKKIKPNLLFSLLEPKIHDNTIYINKKIIQIFHMFIPKIIQYIGKTVIVLEHYKKNLYTEKHILEYETNPDYICVNIHTNKRFKEKEKLSLSNLHSFIELQEELYFNGQLYKLDSCILNNYYNDIVDKFYAIAGIHSNNQKYIFNSWIRNQIEFDSKDNYPDLPCEFLQFDWNTTINDNDNDNGFCLTKNCGLDMKIKNKKPRLCFVFGKGIRTVIYVKVFKHKLQLN